MNINELKAKYMMDVSTSELIAARRGRRGTDYQSLKEEFIKLGGDPKRVYGTSRFALLRMVEELRKQKGVKA